MSVCKDYFNFCMAGKTGHFILGSYLTKHRNLGYRFLFLFKQAATLLGCLLSKVTMCVFLCSREKTYSLSGSLQDFLPIVGSYNMPIYI